jgi:predicted DNA-binding transcriptional regulator AlpA
MKHTSDLPQSHRTAVTVCNDSLASVNLELSEISKKLLTSSCISNAPTTIHWNLANFDQLPSSALVRLPIVLGLVGCSKATLWRWVKSSRVPAPKKPCGGRISAWNVGELRACLATFQSSDQSSSKVRGE